MKDHTVGRLTRRKVKQTRRAKSRPVGPPARSRARRAHRFPVSHYFVTNVRIENIKEENQVELVAVSPSNEYSKPATSPIAKTGF